ncbi:MAG: glycine dehydrogenase, partial [Phycisphaerales bacterium]|nr:glycine dehydrogenase [Phycisphaerales bacterium]
MESTLTPDTTDTSHRLRPTDTFPHRHIGPSDAEIAEMLRLVGVDSLDRLIDETIPRSIRLKAPLKLDEPVGERDLLARLKRIAAQNQVFRNYIGMGYSGTITPPVIQRNILENPGWYTQYTPYQAEIAQGRLEMLLNFQTMVADLTGLPLANASLLDEATAAAEAMTLCHRVSSKGGDTFLLADDCHPQTIEVLRTRAEPLGIRLIVACAEEFDFAKSNAFGALVQYPNTYGVVEDYAALVANAHAANTLVVVATDLLALALLRAPGEFGADVAIGSSQRFGVPLGFGGPHAAFMATREEYLRQVPGRIVGVSRDAQGDPAYRLTVQTREQHIRRDKATSNICTAQVLLAVMAAAYAIYHGPQGLRAIADRTNALTEALRDGLRRLGVDVDDGPVFDTIRTRVPDSEARDEILARARHHRVNLRQLPDGFGISLDETTASADVETLWRVFAGAAPEFDVATIADGCQSSFRETFGRNSDYLTHPVFNTYHSEHELLRYLHRLQSRDLSLTHSMIPLGSCTMKLNATSEMIPVTWPEFGGIHPFAPAEQTLGFRAMFESLEDWLAEITGFAAISLQPNAGAQGEYAGLLVIRAYHHSRGDAQRDVCLIP